LVFIFPSHFETDYDFYEKSFVYSTTAGGLCPYEIAIFNLILLYFSFGGNAGPQPDQNPALTIASGAAAFARTNARAK
ncbi:MAG: hypothetical protein IKX55_09125, partial [Bacteroidaceae bacterium]|nr:hypothetical protein [Bacteroidaceae bacterium]